MYNVQHDTIQGDTRPSLCEPLLADSDQHHGGELELEETLVNEGRPGEGSGEADAKRRGSVGAQETEINPKAAEEAVICRVKVPSPLSPPPTTNVPFKPLQSPSSHPQRTPEYFESPGCNAVAEESQETKAGE